MMLRSGQGGRPWGRSKGMLGLFGYLVPAVMSDEGEKKGAQPVHHHVPMEGPT